MTSATSRDRHAKSLAHRSGRPSSFFDQLEPRQLLTAIIWDGGAGDNFWHSAANWSGDTVPTAADDAVISLPASSPTIIYNATSGARSVRSLINDEAMTISGGALSILQPSTFNGPLTVSSGTLDLAGATLFDGAVSFSNGTITGSGDMTFNGSFDWSFGTLGGSGTSTISTSGSLALSGSTHTLGRDLINDGSATWTAGNVHFDGATFTSNGQFTATFASIASMMGISGVNTFANTGTFQKLGAGNARFIASSTDVAFNNSGTATVASGELSLHAGGLNLGTFAVGATLNFSGSAYTNGATSIIGGTGDISTTAGTVTFAGTHTGFTGDFSQSGGTATANSPFPNISTGLFTNGTLNGSADVTFGSTFTWNFGEMSGTGRTIIGPGATATLASSTHTLMRELTNNGAINWTAGNINFNNGTLANNGTLTTSSTGIIQALGIGGANVISNAGQFIRSGPGETRFIVSTTGVAFNNTGTVTISGGTLNIGAGGTSSGTMSPAAGATLEFSGNLTYTHTPASSVQGASGTLLVSAGTVNFEGAVSGIESFDQSGGTANFNTTSTATFVGGNISNGTLAGSSGVSFSGVLAWTFGTMTGSGQTIITPTGSLSLNSSTHTLERTLTNNGAINWTAGNINLNNGAINNTANFTANSAGVLQVVGIGGVNTFNNTGTLNKLGAGELRFTFSSSGVTLLNPGTINVQSGDIALNQAIFTNSGSISLLAGSQIAVTGAFVQTDTGSLTTQLAGTAANDLGRMTSTLTATIEGDLTATLLGGFNPQRFDRFDIVTGSTLVGTFDTVTFPAAAANRKWAIVYQTNRAQLLYTSIADWDNSGTIGSADITAFLAAWFADLQNNTLIADFDHNNTTGSSDITAFLTAWFFALGGG
ncbi:MAG: hypothetical protein H7Y88_04955 [Phycisphaerales bacterium]|nr:hypothetical protein [Phycisphaerales bacterium]